MRRPGVISLNLDLLLKYLFCAYALSLSFELFFEIAFNVKTIFKPFRIIALLIFGVFGIKVLREGLEVNVKERNDVFFYLLVLYGIIVSYIQIMAGPFNKALFYNDLFLVGLNVLVFFVFKSLKLGEKDLLQICYFFIGGVIFNCLFIFYTFFFQGIIARQSGFYDNPNYTSLATSMALTFLLLMSNYLKEFWKQIFVIVCIFFLAYVFLITGSRSGLVVLFISVFLVFLFSSIYRKVGAIVLLLGFLVFLIPKNLEETQIGGPLILIKRINKKMDQDEVDVRFVIWDGVFRMLETEGYMGMGLGQYKDKFENYFSNSSHLYILNIVERGYFLSTHNDYLAILTDYGLPSLAFYLLFIFFSFLKLLQNILYPKEDDSEAFAFLSKYKFILLCSLVIFGMASENLPNPLFWFLMMLATKDLKRN